MANGINTLSTKQTTQLQKPTVNFPVQQPGQQLPLVPQAIQGPQGPQPIQRQQGQGQAQAPTVPQVPQVPQAPSQPASQLGAASGVFDPNLSQKVLQGAQEKALQGTPQETAGLVSQQTQNLLRDPSLGRDPEAEKKLALDQLRRRQAEGFEQFRQATGGQANLGINLQDLVSAQVQQRQELTDTERQLDIDEQNRKQQEMLAALGQGAQTAQLEQQLQTGDIQNLINAAGGVLGFAELASRENVLLSEQEFQATQNALDQELQLAIQNNDLAAQKDILDRKLAFEKNQGQLNREFTASESALERNFLAVQNTLDQKFQLAVQSNDIEAQKEALAEKLAFEREQSQLGREFTAQQSELNRILETNLANLDANTQKEMVNLKAAVDKDLLLTQQDFASTEAEIQRQFQEAMQTNDFAQANSMALMLNEFDTLKQQAQQEWQSAENLVNNAFTQQMQMDQNEFNKAMQFIQHDLDLAKADDNFEKQQFLMDKENELQLQMLTQNFQHDEKMAILDSELQEAKANGDLTRQKQLLDFSSRLELKKAEQEQGFEMAMAQLNNKLTQALQSNDYLYAKALNELQYKHQMQMHMDEMALGKAKIQLEQQGIDMARIEQEYSKIQDLIAQGQVDPSDAVEYVAQVFEQSLPEDFEFNEPDPFSVQKAMKEDYINQQFQYALSNGIDVTIPENAEFNENGDFIGLKGELLGSFNDHLNETLYGQTGTPLEADLIALKTGDLPYSQLTGKDDPRYKALLEDSSVPKTGNRKGWNRGETGRGSKSRTTYRQLENASFAVIDDNLYKVDGFTIQDRAGDDWTKYKLINVLTGEVLEQVAKE